MLNIKFYQQKMGIFNMHTKVLYTLKMTIPKNGAMFLESAKR